jgi:putative transposase
MRIAVMPRTARAVEAGMIYHVLNRGNGRARLFHDDQDYLAFAKVLAEGLKRYPVDLLTFCLMSNHWHLVVRPRADKALGRLMGWVGVTHVRRHHARYRGRGGGHLYQGRFKSFPIQDDRHFLTVCRYVEANARRAGLARRAQDWQFGGLYARQQKDDLLALCDWPLDRPANWAALVNAEIDENELSSLRASVNRGRPFGGADWIARTARRLGLEFALRDPGRPKREKGNE